MVAARQVSEDGETVDGGPATLPMTCEASPFYRGTFPLPSGEVAAMRLQLYRPADRTLLREASNRLIRDEASVIIVVDYLDAETLKQERSDSGSSASFVGM